MVLVLAYAGVKSPRNVLYWKTCIQVMNEFVMEQDEATVEV